MRKLFERLAIALLAILAVLGISLAFVTSSYAAETQTVHNITTATTTPAYSQYCGWTREDLAWWIGGAASEWRRTTTWDGQPIATFTSTRGPQHLRYPGEGSFDTHEGNRLTRSVVAEVATYHICDGNYGPAELPGQTTAAAAQPSNGQYCGWKLEELAYWIGGEAHNWTKIESFTGFPKFKYKGPHIHLKYPGEGSFDWWKGNDVTTSIDTDEATYNACNGMSGPQEMPGAAPQPVAVVQTAPTPAPQTSVPSGGNPLMQVPACPSFPGAPAPVQIHAGKCKYTAEGNFSITVPENWYFDYWGGEPKRAMAGESFTTNDATGKFWPVAYGPTPD